MLSDGINPLLVTVNWLLYQEISPRLTNDLSLQ